MVDKSISYFPSKCETSPAFQSDSPIFKTNVNYFMEQKSKSKHISAHLYYVFPLNPQNNNICIKNGLCILKKFLETEWFSSVSECEIQIDINHFVIRDINEESRTWELETQRILCAVNCSTMHNNRELIAVVIKGNDKDDGFVFYFGLETEALGICKIINSFAEKSCDNFVLQIHSSNEITINSKVLKYHIDILNSIIKEIIDMAIVVARFVETRKKLEKKSKGYKIQKCKEVSFKLVASAPTTEEFVDLLKKVRVALNLMARLNPFVTNPNIPELLHHMIAPFSLITSVCGHQLVKSVKKPFLTVKTIWLIEHCFTTNELAFWRTLGDGWNKPCNVYDIEDLHDIDYKPKLKYFQEYLIEEPKSILNFQSDEGSSTKNDSNLGVIVQYHHPCRKEEIYAYPGGYVYIADELEDSYKVVDVFNCNGWIPKSKVNCFGLNHKFNVFNQHVKTFIDENFIKHIKRENTEDVCVEDAEIHLTSCSHQEEPSEISESNNAITENINYEDTKSQKSQKSEEISLHSCITNEDSHRNISKSSMSLQSKSTKKSKSENKSVDIITDSKSKKSMTSLASSESLHKSKESHSEKTNESTKSKCKVNIEKKKKKFCGWCCIRKSTISNDRSDCRDISLLDPSTNSHSKSSSTVSLRAVKEDVKDISEGDKVSYKSFEETSTKICDENEKPTTPLCMDVDKNFVKENESKCLQPEQRTLPNKEISLSWKKTEAPESDFIKIEGMKLFKVRIKMVDSHDTSQDIVQGIGKSTLLLQNHSHVDLKPNSKICIHRDETTNDMMLDEKSITSKDSCSSPYKSININEEKHNIEPRKVNEYGQKYISPLNKSNTSELKISKNSQMSVSSNNYKQNISQNLSQTKIKITKPEIETQQVVTENIKMINKDSNMVGQIDSSNNSSKIMNLIKKYAPDSNIPNLAIKMKEANSPKENAQDSIDEFYDKHVCKDCGGVCDDETTVQQDKSLPSKSLVQQTTVINDSKTFIKSGNEIPQHTISNPTCLESKIDALDSEYIKNAMKWSSNETSFDTSKNSEILKNSHENQTNNSVLTDPKINSLEISDSIINSDISNKNLPENTLIASTLVENREINAPEENFEVPVGEISIIVADEIPDVATEVEITPREDIISSPISEDIDNSLPETAETNTETPLESVPSEPVALVESRNGISDNTSGATTEALASEHTSSIHINQPSFDSSVEAQPENVDTSEFIPENPLEYSSILSNYSNLNTTSLLNANLSDSLNESNLEDSNNIATNE